MARIAFIGLGKMGLGMAGRLLVAGHQLNVYNRTPEKAAPLMGAGVRLCASPGETCGDADAVVSMVADDAASREVWFGADGVLAAMAARTGTRCFSRRFRRLSSGTNMGTPRPKISCRWRAK